MSKKERATTATEEFSHSGQILHSDNIVCLLFSVKIVIFQSKCLYYMGCKPAKGYMGKSLSDNFTGNYQKYMILRIILQHA